MLLAEGKAPEALEAARRALDEAMSGGLGRRARGRPHRLPHRPRGRDRRSATSRKPIGSPTMLAARPRGEVPPFLRAQITRAEALVAGARGDDEAVEENLVAAEATFRELGYPYWTARAQLDRAEWLAGQRAPTSQRGSRPKPPPPSSDRGRTDARSRTNPARSRDDRGGHWGRTATLKSSR